MWSEFSVSETIELNERNENESAQHMQAPDPILCYFSYLYKLFFVNPVTLVVNWHNSNPLDITYQKESAVDPSTSDDKEAILFISL